MAEHDISAKLNQFLFDYIDSVELIEVLLLVQNHSDKKFNAAQISAELRSNPTSISNRLTRLAQIGLLEQDKDLFWFHPRSDELKELVTELASEYLLRRHRIFEIIFSSSKTARRFANAFIINKADEEE